MDRVLPPRTTLNRLHCLFEPQFCHLLHGNDEHAYVCVLCLNVSTFRRLVNGSTSKRKAGFPLPIKAESCTCGPGLSSTWLLLLWLNIKFGRVGFFLTSGPSPKPCLSLGRVGGVEGGSVLSPSLFQGPYAQASVSPVSWS